jgi:hypothetical protein
MRKPFYALLITLFITSGCLAQQVTVRSSDSHIHYMGRVDVQADKSMLSWPGTSLKINFNGTGVKATLKDEIGENFYNVIVDGKVIQKLHLDTAKHEYNLAANLPVGKHSLELVKVTEWDKGKTWFYGFNLDAQTQLLAAPKTKKRKIEFFGNSITCGYGVLDTTGKDRGTGEFEDNYQSYAAITARHFDAEYYCIAKSGIGMMVSWFPLIMPEMYNRLDATDAQSRWDFKKYTPDVVVVNLFQNDSWIVTQPQNGQFKARFGNTAPTPQEIIKAYEAFVKTLRSTYPKAQIICALGNMDATRKGSVWPGYIEQAVKNLNDKQIYTHMFPFKNTPGHPRVKEQQAMATDLIDFIEKNVKW